jgi:tetratricopeptide (TPR) repeat protein
MKTIILINQRLFSGIFLLIGILFLFSCSKSDMINFKTIDKIPKIQPDYSNITIPPNIAPLNFYIDEDGTKYYVKIYSKNGIGIIIKSKDSGIKIPIKQWKKLLKQNTNNTLFIDIHIMRNNIWFKYNTIKNQIADDPIDNYIVYRLIYPQFYIKNRMDIYQRNIENYSKKRIITQKEGCFNCHTFYQYRPDKFLVQARIYKKNYLLLNYNNKISLITPRLKRPGSAYLSWHPSGDMFAVSTDMGVFVWNFIAGKGAEEVLEYTDTDADMAIYNIETNTVTTTRDIAKKERMETHPAWTPDGKYLYFLSAPRVPKEEYDKVKYDLMRIRYNIDTDKWGTLETVISSKENGMGCTFPRFSPDGKYLLFCMTDRGSFSILRKSTDLYLMDMKTNQYRRLEINSDRTDSYHAWSSNSRWISFVSKRGDAIFGKVYISYFDSTGRTHKQFLLPQKDPYFYDTFAKTYHRVEFLSEPVNMSLPYLNKIISDTSKIIIANVDNKIDGITKATPKVTLDKDSESEKKTIKSVSMLKKRTQESDTIFKKGIEYHKKGQTAKAEEVFKKTIQINPYHTRSHYMLALYYTKQKKYTLAIKHCDLAMEYGADFPDEYLEVLKPYRNDVEQIHEIR